GGDPQDTTRARAPQLRRRLRPATARPARVTHPREALALRDELLEPERSHVTAHLLTCDACRALARELDVAAHALAMPEPPMPLPPMRSRGERGMYSGL